MVEGQLFLNFLKYYVNKLIRLNDLDVMRLEKQFLCYNQMSEVFRTYKYKECFKRVKKNNSFRFNAGFYRENKKFFELLRKTRYNGKKVYTLPKTVYT